MKGKEGIGRDREKTKERIGTSMQVKIVDGKEVKAKKKDKKK